MLLSQPPVMYVPFHVGCGIFAALNAAVSVRCWYTSGRGVVLATGALDSLVGGLGAVTYTRDPHLGSFCASAGATCAGVQFTLHAMHTPMLWRGTAANALYFAWIIGLFWYAYDCGRWSWALRFD